MHFGGVIISDDMGAAAAVASLSPAARAIGFLAAGGDMILSDSLAAAAAMDDRGARHDEPRSRVPVRGRARR